MLFRGTCLSLVHEFMGEQHMTSRDISAPKMFNTPWHPPLGVVIGEAGALVVVKSSLSLPSATSHDAARL
jgi:hypothetical protein